MGIVKTFRRKQAAKEAKTSEELQFDRALEAMRTALEQHAGEEAKLGTMPDRIRASCLVASLDLAAEILVAETEDEDDRKQKFLRIAAACYDKVNGA